MQFCIGFCGPDLYKIIKACIAPKTISGMKYAEMKLALKAYFEPKKNKLAERFKFHSRQQKSGETVADYIMELKALSRTCEFDDYLEEALRDQLVFGIGDSKIQSALLREKELTFENACSIAKNIELTTCEVVLMQQDNSIGVFSRNRLGPRQESNGNSRDKKKPRYANYQCYNCLQYGHTSRMCRNSSAKGPNQNNNQKNRVVRAKINDIDGKSDAEESEADEDLDLSFLNHVSAQGPVFSEVSIDNILIRTEIDTGACQAVMSERDANKYFPNLKLHPFRMDLSVVTGDPVKILGYGNVKIAKEINSDTAQGCKLVIIKSKRNFVPLCGRTWLDILFPGWRT